MDGLERPLCACGLPAAKNPDVPGAYIVFAGEPWCGILFCSTFLSATDTARDCDCGAASVGEPHSAWCAKGHQ